MHAGFKFADAAAVVPYLAALGISHLYLSPIQQAAPGSTHGYDQCDPRRVSKELGGEPGFLALAATARSHGLGIVLDIVPNHMATAPTNPWWWELLAGGREGPAGAYFDIEWNPDDPELSDRVLLPVLGAPLEEVLANGELRLGRRGDQQVLTYFDHEFPLRTPSLEEALTPEVLARQHYLPAFWRDAGERLNYRRFFDINSLVALREEAPEVFKEVHALPLRLVREGLVQGLRVDHVDGLRDPHGYLEALRDAAPGAWVVVEKILEPGEQLPGPWPVAGTTGYDFTHRLLGVFVDPAAEADLTRIYAAFTGETADYGRVVRDAKLDVGRRLFGSDLARLDRLFASVCASLGLEASPRSRRDTLLELGACLPVYRGYARPGEAIREPDAAAVEAAMAAASELPHADVPLLRALGDILLLRTGGDTGAELAMRFQQFSGPLMAKGVEDTAFYRYVRLVCLNEVGSDPGGFGVGLEEFHDANTAALAGHPETMLASSTHDTKRSEDVRARLALLSHVPGAWEAAVRRWAAANARHRRGDLPDRNTEYLLYQVLVGAWPLSEQRAHQYMEKAVREAKRHTSWTDPDPAYEDAVRGFVSGILRDQEFVADLGGFVAPLVDPGRTVSLGMTLIKLTAPGVPDIYQGTELWDLSLVDPDNRRPVDYGLRSRVLHGLSPAAVGAPADDGEPKLRLVVAALRTRRSAPLAFAPGSRYTPLRSAGDAVVAYARGTADDPLQVIVVVPRRGIIPADSAPAGRLDLGAGSWADTLSGRRLDGGSIAIAEALRDFPVALLVRA
jgi:(1->4)-alpha-D-glucan 1-alpha-D-glucosylmutase